MIACTFKWSSIIFSETELPAAIPAPANCGTNAEIGISFSRVGTKLGGAW